MGGDNFYTEVIWGIFGVSLEFYKDPLRYGTIFTSLEMTCLRFGDTDCFIPVHLVGKIILYPGSFDS